MEVDSNNREVFNLDADSSRNQTQAAVLIKRLSDECPLLKSSRKECALTTVILRTQALNSWVILRYQT